MIQNFHSNAGYPDGSSSYKFPWSDYPGSKPKSMII